MVDGDGFALELGVEGAADAGGLSEEDGAADDGLADSEVDVGATEAVAREKVHVPDYELM